MDPRWDVIAISAMDEEQAYAFHKQFQVKGEISKMAKSIRVYADEPKGVKIGSGGALLNCINYLYIEFDQKIFDYRILVIAAGGYSQRQPNASFLGKLFMSIPAQCKEGTDLSLFEVKLQSYSFLLDRMEPGIFMAASDTLEYFGDMEKLKQETWSMSGDGFVALAHPSPLDVGRRHGVYVLDDDSKRLVNEKPYIMEAACRRVLQKPSVELMHQESAVVEFGGLNVVFTDSAYYISAKMVRKLLEIYHYFSRLSFELDAYGDFMQPLGTSPNDDYLTSTAVNALVQSNDLLTARRYLFETLKGTPLKLLVFGQSCFYHLGTLDDLLRYFCSEAREKFCRHFNTRCVVFSSIMRPLNSSNICVISSDIGGELKCPESSKLFLEYCQFGNDVEIALENSNCILSYCSSNLSKIRIPASVVMMTMPIIKASITLYVTVIFGIKDDLKSVINSDLDLHSIDGFSGLKLLENTANRNLFDVSCPHTLWYARLFPAFLDNQSSFNWTLDWLNAVLDGSEFNFHAADKAKCGDNYSMHDLLSRKDVDRLLSYKYNLRKMISHKLDCGKK